MQLDAPSSTMLGIRGHETPFESAAIFYDLLDYGADPDVPITYKIGKGFPQQIKAAHSLIAIFELYKHEREDEWVQKLKATIRDRSHISANDEVVIEAIRPIPQPTEQTPE